MTDRLYRLYHHSPLIPRMTRPARTLALALAVGLAAVLGPIACGFITAGGGSGIENPALISSRDLQSLPPGALPMDSLSPDSSMGFNIVVSAGGKEAMLRGFRLRGNRSRGFTFEGGPSGRDSGLNAEIILSQSVLLFPGSMPASERNKDIRVIFVPGSPYFAMVGANGSILFPLLPQGTFPVRAAAYTLLDTSVAFYCTPDSLDTGRPFAPGRWLPCGPLEPR